MDFKKIKLDFKSLFLLLGPIFYFVPLMMHELFVGLVGDYDVHRTVAGDWAVFQCRIVGISATLLD